MVNTSSAQAHATELRTVTARPLAAPVLVASTPTVSTVPACVRLISPCVSHVRVVPVESLPLVTVTEPEPATRIDKSQSVTPGGTRIRTYPV